MMPERSDDYEVGFGKPPKRTQFKPGQSGNPRGRPKGARGLKTELAEELNERISVTESGSVRKVSKLRAVLKAMTAKALSGDPRAANVVLNLVQNILDDEASDEESKPMTKADAEILAAFEKEILTAAEKKETSK